jgi:DNA-binding winged helix-turn-helix (wHTH) protein
MSSEISSTLEPEAAAASGPSIPVTSRYIRLGPFQVDRHRQEVTKNGVRLKLRGNVYQALLVLIEKQGDVVTREQLRARLWPADTLLNYDANVNTTVNKLRQALGDSPDQPLYIKTISRKGYCLVISAEFADSPLPPAVTNDGWLSGRVNGAKTLAAAMKSQLWITFGVVALILTSMLLGAVITKLWILHLRIGNPK